LFTGITFFLILFFSGKWIAIFYDNVQLEAIVQWVAIIFILQAFTYVQQTLFRKQLDFKTIFLVELMSLLAGGSTAIIMAYNGFGVYSLIAQLLVNTLVSVITLWFFSSWRPSFEFSFERIKAMLGYSLPLMGSSALGYVLGNLDKLLIGKFLGNQSLGLYSRAYSLMVFPVGQISGVISQVMFPSLAQIQHDKPRIKEIYLKMNRVISFVTFPMMGLAFLLAEPFVLLVLGEQWREMIPLFKIFTVVGALQSVGTLVGNIYMALGEMKLYFKVNLYSGIVFILASIIGVKFGVTGVAIAYSLASVAVGIPQWIVTGKLINVSLLDYFKAWFMNILTAIVSTGSVGFLFFILGLEMHLIESIFAIALFLFLFVGVNWFFNRKSFLMILNIR
jgi:PST family polysaccharide transporter